MFSNDDHSGLAALLLCLVILVMAGVFLSLVIDGNVRFSRNRRMLDEEIQAGVEEVAHLSRRLATLEALLSRETAARKDGADALDKVRVLAGSMAGRKRALVDSGEVLKTDLKNVELAFAGYRDRRRKEASGRSLGVIRLRTGREFRQVVITRVTPEGLEIRHESGTARLAALELDDRLWDEFQWKVPAKGGLVPQPLGSGGSSSPSRREVDRRSATEEPKGADPVLLQAKVRAAMAKVRSLKTQRGEASSKATFGSGKSVPGTLETWAQRAETLGARVAAAEQELAKARAALAAVSPGDPLLDQTIE